MIPSRIPSALVTSMPAPGAGSGSSYAPSIPCGNSSPPKASSSCGMNSRKVSIIRTKLASSWPAASSPPSFSACSCSRSSKRRRLIASLVSSTKLSLSDQARATWVTSFPEDRCNCISSLVMSWRVATTLPPSSWVSASTALSSTWKSPPAAWSFIQSVRVALGATFTLSGRTGSEPRASRRVDSRSSAFFALLVSISTRPCSRSSAANVLDLRMKARGSSVWTISSLSWSRSFLNTLRIWSVSICSTFSASSSRTTLPGSRRSCFRVEMSRKPRLACTSGAFGPLPNGAAKP
ncbi:hypothetical protein LT19_06527 [Pseudomonas aeruginosa]|nr:hypothetical protein LT19_06527 [Pseudomonas aeruginosa]